MALFNRVKKRISLTDAGELYVRQVRESLDRLERETLSVMTRRGAGGTIELAVIPTFATRWLIPRLPQFHSRHPDITLNLTTRAEPFLFNDTPFDAAIHFGDPIWPGALADYLFGEEMVPVCSPRLLEGRSCLDPGDLQNYTLLHQSSRPLAWRQWFEQAGVTDIDAMKGPRYELFSMLVEAARAGLGIALVPRFFVLNEKAAGELIIPCDLPITSDRAYYLVYPERKQGSELLRKFQEWLLEAARQYRETYRVAAAS